MEPNWLKWAKQIQSLAQAGLTYSKDVYDIERFEELRRLSVEIMAEYTNAPMPKVTELFANETGYQTPKIDVRGVVFEGDKILMVREKLDGRWSLPGGWADVGLSPNEVAVKEVLEESGFVVEPERLLAVFDLRRHPHPPSPYHIYKIMIRCRVVGGSLVNDSTETSEAGFFGEDELPELSESRVTPEQLQMMFDFLRHPEKPALCD